MLTPAQLSAEVFLRPGVNPQSRDPNISGDSCINTVPTLYGQRLIGVVDGAWVPGFDHRRDLVPDIADWSSNTIARAMASALHQDDDTYHSVNVILNGALYSYRASLAALKRDVGYTVEIPSAFASLDPLKIGPQSAFVVALFNPDGTIDIAQVRDCLAVAEMVDGGMHRLTPNQSETSAAAGKVLGIQNEKAAVNAYQSLAKEIILAGEWAPRRAEVLDLARQHHTPGFFPAVKETLEALPDDLSGEEGFKAFLVPLEILCLCHNSATFNNNVAAPEVELPDGTRVKASWAMFTGEADMFPLTNGVRVIPDPNMRALWLMSDGAFKQGDRGEDLNALRKLGMDRYYREVLLPRFDGSAPGRKRYHPERVPMDVTIIRIPLL